MRRHFLILLIFICFLAQCNLSARGSDYVQNSTLQAQQIDQLSNKILKSEIEFHRLTINFGVKNIVENIAKKRRQYIWDGGNSAATEAGLITADAVFYRHSKYRKGFARVSKDVPGSQNAGQFYPQIIGQEFNAAGNVYELVSNVALRKHRLHQQIAPSQAISRARKLLSQIDTDISARENLLEATSVENDYALESKALRVLRNALVQEFCSTYVLRLREFFGLNTVEIVDLVRNTIGAIGNQLSVRAGYTGNHHLNGLGNVLADISAFTITLKPLILQKVLAFEEKRARREVAVKLGQPDDFAADLNRLDQYRNYHFEAAPLSRRQSVIDREIHILTKSREDANENQIRQNKIVRTETGRDLFTGPTKVTSSTLSVVGQYDSHISKNATERNRLSAAGNTAYTVGQAYNFKVLTRWYLDEEFRNHRARKAHDTPVERRLRHDLELQGLEQSLDISDSK